MNEPAKPFPLPETFPCPFCEGTARQGNYTNHDCLLHFGHEIKTTHRVGQVISVVLTTQHGFAVKWISGCWVVVPESNPQSCERVRLHTGDMTDWRVYDQEILTAEEIVL